MHTSACSVIYCLRELQKECLIHFAFELSHNTRVKYELLSFKRHPFCLSPTAPLNITSNNYCLQAHPLNILLFFNEDWTSSSFVTVTSCDGNADQHITAGRRRGSTSWRERAGTESMWRAACMRACAATVKSILGKANRGNKKSCKFVELTLKCWWPISSQFHGLLVWQHEFTLGRKQQINGELCGCLGLKRIGDNKGEQIFICKSILTHTVEEMQHTKESFQTGNWISSNSFSC